MSKRKLIAALALAGGLCFVHNVHADLVPEGNAPVLYGYSVDDNNASIPDVKVGFGSFSSVQGSIIVDEGSSAVNSVTDAGYCNGKLYVYRSVYNWLTGNKAYIDVYDAESWEKLSSNELSKVPDSGRGLSFNADGTKIYCLSGNSNIISIDLETFQCEDVTSTPSWNYNNAFCAGPEGIFYTASDEYIFVTSAVTGETTNLPAMEINTTRSAIFYDSHSDLIYMVKFDYDDNAAHAYTINPTTAALTDLGVISGVERIYGLTMLRHADDAPDAVSNVGLTYASVGSSDCEISFTMPTITYGGSALTGAMSAIVEIDGVRETVSAQAGEDVVLPKTFANGMHHVSIYASLNDVLSPERRFSTFTGVDAPAAPQNVLLAIDGQTGTATLTWDAPTASVNGGTFDKAGLTYRIVRNPGEIVVVESQTGTSFTEELGDAFGHYSYTVIPMASGMEGTPATSNEVVSGSVNVPTFTETFAYWQDFDNRYVTENPLDNGYGWQNSGGAYCMVDDAVNSDYYLFTPAMRLNTDETYTLSFDYSAAGWGDLNSVIDVYICREPDTSAAAWMVFQSLVSTENSDVTYFYDFNVYDAGNYYICFHAITPMGGSSCRISGYSVAVNSAVTAPEQVSDLKVKAGEKGDKSAMVTFTLPTTNVDGSALSNISKVVVTNETTGANVATIDNAVLAGTYEYVDTDPVEGFNTYSVTVYSGDAKGMTAHASVFVGVDQPGIVSTVNARADGDKNVITWTAPSVKGTHGGYVDVDALTYNVYRMDDPDAYYTPCIASDITGYEYTDETCELPEGKKQSVVKYIVRPVYEGAEGNPNSMLLTIGTAYDLPYKDSFSHGAYGTDGWMQSETEGKASWSVANGFTTVVKPSDLDEGMLQFVNAGMEPSSATLRSPRMMLGLDATVGFDVYHGFDADAGDLTVTVMMMNAAGEISEIGTVDYNNGTSGWGHHTMKLGSFDTPEDAILLIRGYGYDGSASLFVDNLTVYRGYDKDMEMLNLNVPAAAEVGATEAVIKVFNAGQEAATFDVVLYKNDNEVARETVENLAAGEAKTLTVDMGLTPGDAMSTATYRAEIVYNGDENTANNTSADCEVFVKRNTIPTVELEGEYEANRVDITWESADNNMIRPVTDSFEEYSPYALDNFGDWRTLDVDGAGTYFQRYWNQITNAKAPMAWEVWNNETVKADGFYDFGASEDAFTARSGNSALINFTAMETGWFGDTPSQNDNWLISPEVLAGTDATFYVRCLYGSGTENIEVYYTADSDVDFTVDSLGKFELIQSYTVEGNDWREITFTLPADAVRFAIRHCTNGGDITLIDDITYTPASGNTVPVEVIGYNVYRNDSFLSFTESTEFADEVQEGGLYTYYVTTVTSAGESSASNIFYAELEGASVDAAGAETFAVRAVEGGIVITTGAAVRCKVFTVDGVVIFDQTVDGVKTVSCGSGVYVVNVNGVSRKLIVK